MNRRFKLKVKSRVILNLKKYKRIQQHFFLLIFSVIAVWNAKVTKK